MTGDQEPDTKHPMDLGEDQVKWLLMTICYTHKSVPSFANIREASPAAGGKKYRDPQPDTKQRVKDLGTLALNGMTSSSLSLQYSWNHVKEAKNM